MKTDLFAILDGDANEQASPLVVVEHAGPPIGKGRPRFRVVTPRAGKPFAHVYTPPETKAYESALGWKARAAMKGRPPFNGPLAVRIFALLPIPKSWPQRDRDAALAGTKLCTARIDGDNIAKVCGDSCNSIIWDDDRQIVRWLIVKEYAENPGLIVEVYALP